ncbi:MAG: cysteine hydrolase, partial [Deltaproteobacteria bacterium]
PEGSLRLHDLEHVMPHIVKVIALFREKAKPIIHIVRLYEKDGSNADLCRRWHIERGKLSAAVPGTWGSQLVDCTNINGAELDPPLLLSQGVQEIGPHEFIVYKPRFNAFHRTSLNSFLKSISINSVIIVGLTFPNCIRATQLGAADHDYRVGLVASACTEPDELGLRAMAAQGVQLLEVDALADLLSGAT